MNPSAIRIGDRWMIDMDVERTWRVNNGGLDLRLPLRNGVVAAIFGRCPINLFYRCLLARDPIE